MPFWRWQGDHRKQPSAGTRCEAPGCRGALLANSAEAYPPRATSGICLNQHQAVERAEGAGRRQLARPRRATLPPGLPRKIATGAGEALPGSIGRRTARRQQMPNQVPSAIPTWSRGARCVSGPVSLVGGKQSPALKAPGNPGRRSARLRPQIAGLRLHTRIGSGGGAADPHPRDQRDQRQQRQSLMTTVTLQAAPPTRCQCDIDQGWLTGPASLPGTAAGLAWS